MTEVVLHLGSNLGQREQNLDFAQLLISEKIGMLLSVSNIYETEAWGKVDQPAFLNLAVIVSTSLNPESVLKKIDIIESKLGRIREEKWGPRTLDIDIIFYGEQIIKKPHLNIPHPELTNRNFVLIPLLDICPERVHPILNKTVIELISESKDTSEVVNYLS